MKFFSIPNHKDYKVSRTGVVLSCKYGKRRILAQNKTPDGYLRSKVDNKPISVHLLVANTFIPKPSDAELQVNHKDGNKENNSVGNLEWLTHRENLYHAMDTGLHANPRRAVIGKHETTGKEIWFISSAEAGRNGFTQANVSQCLNGIRRKCKHHTWRYA